MKNKNYYYSESEWDRLGCGPLPSERDISNLYKNDSESEEPLVYPEDDGYDRPRNPYSRV